MPYLPKGTDTSLAFGLAIAGDSKRFTAAAAYWRAALAGLGETIMETGKSSSPALRFASSLPSEPLGDLIEEFAGYFDAADEDGMVRMSGCLMSTAEIAEFVYGDASVDLGAELKFLNDAATRAAADGEVPPTADAKRRAQGLRLAREVYDLVRRFTIATENAATEGATRAELLALHFQEGALGIAPPVSSWKHAPLIATADNACRMHRFLLWDSEANGGTTSRTAFVVAHTAEKGKTPSLRAPVSAGFGTLIRHIVMVAGLDTVIVPRLVYSDELLTWYSQLRAAKAGTYAEFDDLVRDVAARLSDKPSVASTIYIRQLGLGSQRAVFDGLVLGTALQRVAAATSGASIGSEKDLVKSIVAELKSLVATHPVLVETGDHIVLAPADDFVDARACLAAQARWYASRKRVDTLLALRDRADWAGRAQWHAMLAYLRYNIGEFNYLRFLSRFAAKLGHFRSVAIQKKLGLAPSFVTALTKVSWSKADAETARSLLESVNFLASNTNLFVTYGWSNLGFIDALAAQGPVCLEPYSPQPWMSEAADIALNVLTLYADRGLFDLLELFVTSHPVRLQAGGDVNLVGFKPVKSIKPIRNAFSFERIRRAYAQASKDAGLEE